MQTPREGDVAEDPFGRRRRDPVVVLPVFALAISLPLGNWAMVKSTALENLLRHGRTVVIGGLVGVIGLSWVYVLLGAGMGMTAFEMTATSVSTGELQGSAQSEASGSAMSAGSMSDGVLDQAMEAMKPVVWSPGYAALMALMWWTMMVAMMVPTAAPMILLFATVNRRQRQKGAPFVPTGVFAAGYALVWGAFSVVAMGLQWGLERLALLSPVLVSASVVFGGALLIGAGLYQLTPLKHACLRHCRSPLEFITGHWRKGTFGALTMGLEHGAFCLGCCWVLMGLLFYGGVMNLYWIIGLALYVLLEKLIPAGNWFASITGFGLIAWGGVLIAATF